MYQDTEIKEMHEHAMLLTPNGFKQTYAKQICVAMFQNGLVISAAGVCRQARDFLFWKKCQE